MRSCSATQRHFCPVKMARQSFKAAFIDQRSKLSLWTRPIAFLNGEKLSEMFIDSF